MKLPLEVPSANGRAAISIDRMALRDAAPVAALFRQVVEGLPYYNRLAKDSEIAKHTTDELERAVAVDEAAVLVALSDQTPVGFCMSREDDGTLWLAWFGVLAERRGLGIGHMMLDALERRARYGGSHKIWCDSRTTNVASEKILIRHGYRRLCTIADHWYRQDFILWEKSVG